MFSPQVVGYYEFMAVTVLPREFGLATLTEVFPCLSLSCKANARV
jgi:poly-beta-hydroxyalkanoate depolymerase